MPSANTLVGSEVPRKFSSKVPRKPASSRSRKLLTPVAVQVGALEELHVRAAPRVVAPGAVDQEVRGFPERAHLRVHPPQLGLAPARCRRRPRRYRRLADRLHPAFGLGQLQVQDRHADAQGAQSLGHAPAQLPAPAGDHGDPSIQVEQIRKIGKHHSCRSGTVADGAKRFQALNLHGFYRVWLRKSQRSPGAPRRTIFRPRGASATACGRIHPARRSTRS